VQSVLEKERGEDTKKREKKMSIHSLLNRKYSIFYPKAKEAILELQNTSNAILI